jgi:hypothetical protein
MIFRLNPMTGEIDEVTGDQAQRALKSYGWTDWSINNLFRSATVLCTRFFYFSRFRSRLEEMASEGA